MQSVCPYCCAAVGPDCPGHRPLLSYRHSWWHVPAKPGLPLRFMWSYRLIRISSYDSPGITSVTPCDRIAVLPQHTLRHPRDSPLFHTALASANAKTGSEISKQTRPSSLILRTVREPRIMLTYLREIQSPIPFPSPNFFATVEKP